eukprot:COSAG05_NODE_2257_length_3328_cov_26.785819_4_plen_65_part_00
MNVSAKAGSFSFVERVECRVTKFLVHNDITFGTYSATTAVVNVALARAVLTWRVFQSSDTALSV